MARLSEEKIGEALESAEGWSREGEAITKDFERGDFMGSVGLVNDIAPWPRRWATIRTWRSRGTRSRSRSRPTPKVA